MRGRPPVTRARVLNYWEAHGPCSIRQMCRAMQVDRSDIKRIMRAAEKAGLVEIPQKNCAV